MADKRDEGKKVKVPSKSSPQQDDADQPAAAPEPEAPPQRKRHNQIPISYYWIKDVVKQFVSSKNFPDAAVLTFALASVSIAFPLFPYPVLAILLIATFALTMRIPLLGLILLFFETLPMLIYQAPLLGWIMTIFMSVSLFLGYKHYRSITFIYALFMLPLSFLGYFLEVPAFIIGMLYIGFRRALIATVIIMFVIAILAGVTGITVASAIVYNSSASHNALFNNPASQYLVPSKPIATLGDLGSAFGSAFSSFFSFQVAGNLFSAFGAAINAMLYDLPLTLIQIAVWILVIFMMTNYVIKSRSGFKATRASFFSLIMLLGYALLSLFFGTYFNPLVIIGFIVTPILIFVLESNNIGIAKELDVIKQDFLGKFGGAFEELTSGSKETLDDVANYDQTKNELREAILAPIEHREITGAYKVKAAKGILLFGPPGTGKTLMMRAIANEIRARFFYVKTSSLLSPYQGESSQALSRIFATARKNVPAVLFFDEIDGIASTRQAQDTSNERQLLSTLLSEMDGFQKVEGIVVVGSTNVPQLLDPSIMRPGRFDKIIYMPLPDTEGRAKIFEYYMKKLPSSKEIDYKKLGELSNRYSGADIKNVCDDVARRVAEDAVKERRVLQIGMEDVVRIMRMTKPSTSLSRIDEYNTFKADYERRTHPETIEKGGGVTLNDVIGLEDAKKALYEAVEVPILHPELIKKYDVQNTKGILLFGPPGTGKTMLMRAVANELGEVHVFTLSGSDISRLGFEKSLLTIKEAFNRAKENSPAIIFLDEIDAILPQRDESSELGVHITSEFLQEMDGIKESAGIVVVGATNRPDKIDSALLRGGRFDRMIFISPPNKEERTRMFQEDLKKVPVGSDIDYEKLGSMTQGYTGADISNVCRQAKLNALQSSITGNEEEHKIMMADMLKILDTVRPSSPSIVMGKYLNFLSMYGGR